MLVKKNLNTNTSITLNQADAKLKFVPAAANVKPFYANVTSTAIKGDIYHKENNFKDFDIQRLIPKMISTDGPKLAVGDVNGDGLADLVELFGATREDFARVKVKNSQAGAANEYARYRKPRRSAPHRRERPHPNDRPVALPSRSR